MTMAMAEDGPVTEFDTRLVDNRLVVVGEIDAATADLFRDALRQAPPDVRVDLASCTFMDSSGLNVLVDAKSGPKPGLVIDDVSPPVRLVLSISGLAEVFEVDEAEPST